MDRDEFIQKTRKDMERLVEPLRRMGDEQRKPELAYIANLMVQAFTEMAVLILGAPLLDE
jgi:hypothetical protein